MHFTDSICLIEEVAEMNGYVTVAIALGQVTKATQIYLYTHAHRPKPWKEQYDIVRDRASPQSLCDLCLWL